MYVKLLWLLLITIHLFFPSTPSELLALYVSILTLIRDCHFMYWYLGSCGLVHAYWHGVAWALCWLMQANLIVWVHSWCQKTRAATKATLGVASMIILGLDFLTLVLLRYWDQIQFRRGKSICITEMWPLMAVMIHLHVNNLCPLWINQSYPAT